MCAVIKSQSGVSGEQLYLDLKHRVLRGDYAPNMKLPSVRTLASRHKVGTATVSRVLSQLESEGLVNVLHGKGVFVSQFESQEKALTIVMLYFCKDEASFSPHTSPFGMSCLQVCRRFCIEHNYTFIHRPLFPDKDNIRRTIDEFCCNDDVGGFIVLYAGNDYFSESAKILRESPKPVVFIDNPWRGKHEFNYVSGDDLQLGLLAAKYLYESGHRKIAYVMWDVARCFRDELLGFRTELIREGEELRDDMIFRVHDLEEERKAISSIIDRILETKDKKEGSEITAVYCDKDRTALALIEKSRVAGISVPEDVSVMGGTGGEVSAHYVPSLTVSYVSATSLAQRACEMLIELIDSPDKAPLQETLEGVVVERESTCRY